jgi:catechol 2,3-dioxygenase-like lactoylglutathione lyase family enzyme
MSITAVLAGLPVADLNASLQWYERLIGRAADAQPMPGLAEWHFAGTGDVQLVEAPDRAGGGLLTLTVADLPAHVDDVRERGVEVEPIDDTTSDKVLFVTVADPDGNAVTLVEQRI